MHQRVLLVVSCLPAIFLTGCAASSAVSGGSTDTPDKASLPPWGVNAHLPGDRTIAEMVDLGVTWARLDLNWRDIEKEQGVYDWSLQDDRVAAVHSAGVEILMSVSATPAWATTSGRENDPPDNSEDWENFMRLAVQRYSDEVQYWGIWNEPNGGDGEYFSGSAEEFRDQILIPGARGVHSVNPGARVVAPGITIHTNWHLWMNDIFSSPEVIEEVDVICVHLYVLGDADDFFWLIDYREGNLGDIPPLENVVKTLGLEGKPLWLEECGWPTDGPDSVTEQEQADFYRELFQGFVNRGLFDAVFPYEMIDDPDVPEGDSSDFGFLRADYSRRGSFFVYQSFCKDAGSGS